MKIKLLIVLLFSFYFIKCDLTIPVQIINNINNQLSLLYKQNIDDEAEWGYFEKGDSFTNLVLDDYGYYFSIIIDGKLAYYVDKKNSIFDAPLSLKIPRFTKKIVFSYLDYYHNFISIDFVDVKDNRLSFIIIKISNQFLEIVNINDFKKFIHQIKSKL